MFDIPNIQVVSQTVVAASATASPGHATDIAVVFWWLFSLTCSVMALGFARWFYNWILTQLDGDELIVSIAGHGAHGAKGSDAHRAAVVGNTVGDPFKDASGPSLNILIKLTSMVSAGVVARHGLKAMEIF